MMWYKDNGLISRLTAIEGLGDGLQVNREKSAD